VFVLGRVVPIKGRRKKTGGKRILVNNKGEEVAKKRRSTISGGIGTRSK